MRITISENRIWLLVFITVLIKIALFTYFKWFSLGTIFGAGNDADYYHSYALGFGSEEVNYWPVILRFLNERGLYNRDIITFISFVTSMTLLPFIYYKSLSPFLRGSFAQFILHIYYLFIYLSRLQKTVASVGLIACFYVVSPNTSCQQITTDF